MYSGFYDYGNGAVNSRENQPRNARMTERPTPRGNHHDWSQPREGGKYSSVDLVASQLSSQLQSPHEDIISPRSMSIVGQVKQLNRDRMVRNTSNLSQKPGGYDLSTNRKSQSQPSQDIPDLAMSQSDLVDYNVPSDTPYSLSGNNDRFGDWSSLSQQVPLSQSLHTRSNENKIQSVHHFVSPNPGRTAPPPQRPVAADSRRSYSQFAPTHRSARTPAQETFATAAATPSSQHQLSSSPAAHSQSGVPFIPAFTGKLDVRTCLEALRSHSNLLSERLGSVLTRMEESFEATVRDITQKCERLYLDHNEERTSFDRQLSLAIEKMRGQLEADILERERKRNSDIAESSTKNDRMLMDVSSRLTGISMRVDAFQSQIEGAHRHTSELDQRTEAMERRVGAGVTRIEVDAYVQSALAPMSSTIESLTNDVRGVKSDMAQVREMCGTLERATQDHAAQLQMTISLPADVSALASRVQAGEQELQTYMVAHSKTHDQLNEQLHRVDSLSSAVETVRADMHDLETKAKREESTSSRVKEAAKMVENLASEVQRVHSRVDALESSTTHIAETAAKADAIGEDNRAEISRMHAELQQYTRNTEKKMCEVSATAHKTQEQITDVIARVDSQAECTHTTAALASALEQKQANTEETLAAHTRAINELAVVITADTVLPVTNATPANNITTKIESSSSPLLTASANTAQKSGGKTKGRRGKQGSSAVKSDLAQINEPTPVASTAAKGKSVLARLDELVQTAVGHEALKSTVEELVEQVGEHGKRPSSVSSPVLQAVREEVDVLRKTTAKHTGTLTSLTKRVDAFDTTIATVASDAADIQHALKVANKRADKMEKDVARLEQRTDRRSKERPALEKEMKAMAGVREDVEGLRKHVVDMDLRVNGCEKHVAQLSDVVASATSAADTTRQAVTTMETRVASAEKLSHANASEVEQLSSRVTALEKSPGRTSRAEAARKDIGSRVEGLVVALDKLDSRVGSCEQDVATHTTQLARINSDQRSAKVEAEANHERVVECVKRVEKLEVRVEDGLRVATETARQAASTGTAQLQESLQDLSTKVHAVTTEVASLKQGMKSPAVATPPLATANAPRPSTTESVAVVAVGKAKPARKARANSKNKAVVPASAAAVQPSSDNLVLQRTPTAIAVSTPTVILPQDPAAVVVAPTEEFYSPQPTKLITRKRNRKLYNDIVVNTHSSGSDSLVRSLARKPAAPSSTASGHRSTATDDMSTHTVRGNGILVQASHASKRMRLEHNSDTDDNPYALPFDFSMTPDAVPKEGHSPSKQSAKSATKLRRTSSLYGQVSDAEEEDNLFAGEDDEWFA